MDEEIATEGGVVPSIPRLIDTDALMPDPSDDIEEDINIHRRSESPNMEHPLFGRSTKRTN